VLVGIDRIWDSSVAEDMVVGSEDFFGQGCRGNHYCGYLAQLQTDYGAIALGKLGQREMGFVSKLKQITN
jgi:hypothetical protein